MAATTATASTTSTPSAAPASPTPSLASDLRLVISDVGASQVRLARLDATDTASITGQYDGVVDDQVVIVNGSQLEAVNKAGLITKLGLLAAVAGWFRDDTVVVSPDLSRWLYAIHDQSSTAQIHLGTPSGDRTIATLQSPDGNAYYRPFAWNASGVYMVRQAVGIGGAGPFLDYEFALAKFDLNTGKVTDVSPACIAYGVLDDGTMICRLQTQGAVEVRTQSGSSHRLQIGTSGAGTNSAFFRVTISPDQKEHVVARHR